jgi:hypothetical protein
VIHGFGHLLSPISCDVAFKYVGYVAPDIDKQVVFRSDVPGARVHRVLAQDNRLLAEMNANI